MSSCLQNFPNVFTAVSVRGFQVVKPFLEGGGFGLQCLRFFGQSFIYCRNRRCNKPANISVLTLRGELDSLGHSHLAQPFIDFGISRKLTQFRGSKLIKASIPLLQVDLRFDYIDLLL